MDKIVNASPLNILVTGSNKGIGLSIIKKLLRMNKLDSSTE
jgi:NAD(P)-dependent dehydrogenase (short-subunit alcohol dehydrogenase family)